MSAYRDQFLKAKRQQEEREEQRKQEEQQRLARQQEISNARREEQHRKARQLIAKFDPEIRKMLRAYGEVHLADGEVSVSDEPVIGCDKEGWIENASWDLTSIFRYKRTSHERTSHERPPKRPDGVRRFHIPSPTLSCKATITISLILSRHFLFGQRVRGFEISGTCGRKRVRPSLKALSTALAELRPEWREGGRPDC